MMKDEIEVVDVEELSTRRRSDSVGTGRAKRAELSLRWR